VDMLTQNGNVFDIFEIKATQTIMTEHFKGMNFFSDIALNNVGKKTLIYGGNEDQQRSLYTVSGWRNI
jgi:plasmid rolling circle replication initiator protein Rep